jgi:branched-chain amino acid aminotransferase
MPKSILVNLNGQLLSADPDTGVSEAKVSVFDRSYLYGDSLYEVVRSYRGRFFGLEEHLERLEKSAQLTHMKLGQTRQDYEREILRTFKAWRELPGHSNLEAYCRLIVSRGEGRIGFGQSCLRTATTYAIIIQPLELPTAAARQKGYNFQISRRMRNDPRALNPAMKTGNYLNNLLAYLEAVEQHGFDDALLLNADGHVTEGTTFNIFYVKRGIIVTPPLDIGILDGITRRIAIQCAKKLGHEVRETRFPPGRLSEADEVFMTSSIKEVFPVTRIDGEMIGNGREGPVTRVLAAEYSAQTHANL